jgi:hypothetical protein
LVDAQSNRLNGQSPLPSGSGETQE